MNTRDPVGRQAEFFDTAFTEHTRENLSGFYAVCTTSNRVFTEAIAARSEGARVLEIGCGDDAQAFRIAHRAERVDAIDIAPVGVRRSREEAERRGFGNVACHVMNAERLGFPDETFDLACGSAILHHLDLGNALPELRRVLKPGGTAVFFEPLGTNPFINLFRRLTPRYRVAEEHPLRRGDLERIRAVFPQARFAYFHFLSLLSIPFRRTPWFRTMHGFLERVDHALFRFAPLRRLAWIVVITAEKSGAQRS